MATGVRKPSDFCRINMLTPRPTQALEFFSRVLGWSFFEMPGIGHGVQVSGHNIGGLETHLYTSPRTREVGL